MIDSCKDYYGIYDTSMMRYPPPNPVHPAFVKSLPTSFPLVTHLNYDLDLAAPEQ